MLLTSIKIPQKILFPAFRVTQTDRKTTFPMLSVQVTSTYISAVLAVCLTVFNIAWGSFRNYGDKMMHSAGGDQLRINKMLYVM